MIAEMNWPEAFATAVGSLCFALMIWAMFKYNQ